MSTVTSKPYICYDPEEINNILKKLEEDPSTAPRGIGQIQFYAELTKVLMAGTPMNISVEEEQNEAAAPLEDDVVYVADEDEVIVD